MCHGKAGQRSTRARGKLSEAQTQRRPHRAERKSGYGGVSFVVSLFLYLSCSMTKDTKKAATVERGNRVKRGGGVRGSRQDRRRLWRPSGRAGGGCAPAHLEKAVSKDDGPRKGPGLHEVCEVSRD